MSTGDSANDEAIIRFTWVIASRFPRLYLGLQPALRQLSSAFSWSCYRLVYQAYEPAPGPAVSFVQGEFGWSVVTS